MAARRMRSSAVPQAGRDAVDRQMDRASRADVGVAGAIAAEQLDLQVFQRVEIGKAVADAALERWVVLEQRRLLRDRQAMPNAPLVLARDPREDRVAQCRVRYELSIARRHSQIGFCE